MSSDPVNQALDQAIAELAKMGEQGIDEAGSLTTILSGIRSDYATGTGSGQDGSLDIASLIIKFSIENLHTPESCAAVLQQSLHTLEAHQTRRIPGKRLFLSYAWNDDAPFVENLYHALTAQGYSVWWDRARLASRGIPIVQELRDAICESTDRFLPIIGPAALTSTMVQQEWRYARESCLSITPIIRLGSTDDVPSDFKRYLWSDFRSLGEGTEPFEKEMDHLQRIISRPPHPVGPLFRVPGRPQPFVTRIDIVERIKDNLLAGISRPQRTGLDINPPDTSNKLLLHGMGGIGKSVIAAEVARDCEVRRAFPDGIFWVALGKNPDLRTRQAELCSWLGDPKQSFADIEEGRARLAHLVQSKSCLIVLDDVWINNEPRSIDAFDVLPSRCRILIGSRETDASLPFSTVEITLMDDSEAIELLTKWTGSEDPLYEEIIDQLGNLPLGLKLTGARLRDGMSPASWLEQFSNISYLRYNMLVRNDPRRSLEISVQLSVDELSVNNQKLYASLGIFPEDMWFPATVVKRMWQHISSQNLLDGECVELIVTLRQLALIEISEDFGSLWLHDLLHDYNRRRLEESKLWADTHNALLETYNPEKRPWYTLPNDGYLYFCLPHHLLGAARSNELYELLYSAPQWLDEVSEDNPQAHSLVINILTTYWDNEREKAEQFLLSWLSRSRAAKCSVPLAVRGAFSLRFDQGLLVGLRHRDKLVRETAAAYAYHRCIQSDEGQQAAIDIFESLVVQAHRHGLPHRRTLEAVMGLAPLLISHDEFSPAQRRQLNELLTQLVRQTLYADARSPIIPPVRRLLLWFFVQLILRLIAGFSAQGSSAANLVEWRSGFEKYTIEQRQPVFEALPYLDYQYGSLDDIRNLLPSLRGLRNQLMNQVIDYALLPRGVQDPEATLSVVESLFSLDDGTNGEHIDAMYVWFVCMEALDTTEIKKEWLAAQRRFARLTMEKGRYGYGVYHTALGKYTYYPLMFYAALYNRLYPEQQVDLIAEFVDQAIAKNDTALLLHIINGFADNRIRLLDYRGPLCSLEPFFHDERVAIQDSLVNTLGYLQRFHPKQIEDCLDQHHVPQVLCNRILREGPKESDMGLHHLALPRGNHFVRDMLVEMDRPSVRLVIGVLDEAFHKETFYDGAHHVVKQLINEIGGEDLL